MTHTTGPYSIEYGSKGQIYIHGNDGYDRICEIDGGNPRAKEDAELILRLLRAHEKEAFTVAESR